MHQSPFIYVYILKCADGSFYVGVTNNIDKRVNEHQSGKHRGSYTYSRLPVELVFCESFTDPESAFKFETRIKKWSKAKKLALINGDFEKLPLLSKKKFKKDE